MTLGPALTPHVAAKALAAWWEMAGLEPFDVENAVKIAARTRGQAIRATPAQAAGQTALPPARLPTTRAQASAARKPIDSLGDAQRLAAACTSIEALHKAVAGFDGCTLKAHARNTVFSDGTPGAPILVIGEAPDRHDDEVGTSFAGPSGQLLDKMLASIGLNRASNCYLTNLIPWRPPGDRKPTSDEIAICKPFIDRHIALAAPKAILFIGGLSAQTLLGSSDSVMKLRTRHFSYGNSEGPYAQCLLSPAYLLNRPSEKALAWRDLLRFEAEISVRGVAFTK
jgi:uracil-DNA glycosylase